MVSFPTWPKFECMEGASARGGHWDGDPHWSRCLLVPRGWNEWATRPRPPGPPALTEEDAVLEGEGRGALLAAEATHSVRDAPTPPPHYHTTTQPRPGVAVPRREPAPAHHELARWPPLRRGARLAPCPAPPTRAGALCSTRLHAPPPARSLGHVAGARCPLEADSRLAAPLERSAR